MMIRPALFILAFLCASPEASLRQEPATVLYQRLLNQKEPYPELLISGPGDTRYGSDGLKVSGAGSRVRLNRYYSLASRFIRYHVRFSANTHAVFESDKGDFRAYIDMAAKQIRMAPLPEEGKTAGFLDAGHDYIVEIHRDYQQSKIRVIDQNTGESAEIAATRDGRGGSGKGAEGPGFPVGLQYDYYCFGLVSGDPLLVKQIGVYSGAGDVSLLIYGDSITEPEGYYPTADFPQAWTQQVIRAMKGKALCSGRGGTTIVQLLERIKNELPYIKARYVMVTIGTNGRNTEENLGELVEYIRSQGAIPILNNIPANESGTQVAVNAVIEKVRQKYGIKGCKFDLVTSIDKDGREVDKTTMYREDYETKQIYHHPNVKGAGQMFQRTRIDVPEIYKL